MSQPREVTSDIVVGIIGNVSAGKTTLLNALLKDRYGEVSMKRCTAGINFFRFEHQPGGGDGGAAEAKGTKDAITRMNKALRSDPKIECSHFAVSTMPFIREMCPSASLVVVDVPGLNENKTAKMYQDYVTRELFPQLDCVILVVDVNQGVNTEEAKSIFELVKDSAQAKHYGISVVVVINKIDDQDDRECQEMAKETETEAKRIFRRTKIPLAFVPMSAELAYVYATITDIDDLEHCPVVEDPKYMKRIGEKELGRAFGELCREGQVRALQESLRRPGELQKRMNECNFQMLVDTLARVLSYEEQQRILIAKVHHAIDLDVADVVKSEARELAAYAQNFVRYFVWRLKMLRVIDPEYNNDGAVGVFYKVWETCTRACLNELARSPYSRDLTINICLSSADAFLKDFMPLMEPDAQKRNKVADEIKRKTAEVVTRWLNVLFFLLHMRVRENTRRQELQLALVSGCSGLAALALLHTERPMLAAVPLSLFGLAVALYISPPQDAQQRTPAGSRQEQVHRTDQGAQQCTSATSCQQEEWSLVPATKLFDMASAVIHATPAAFKERFEEQILQLERARAMLGRVLPAFEDATSSAAPAPEAARQWKRALPVLQEVLACDGRGAAGEERGPAP